MLKQINLKILIDKSSQNLLWELEKSTKKYTVITKQLAIDKTSATFIAKRLNQVLANSIFLLPIQQLCLLCQTNLAKGQERVWVSQEI